MKALAPGDLEQQNMLQTRESEVLGGVEFFVRLRMSYCIIFYITLVNWEFLLK